MHNKVYKLSKQTILWSPIPGENERFDADPIRLLSQGEKVSLQFKLKEQNMSKISTELGETGFVYSPLLESLEE